MGSQKIIFNSKKNTFFFFFAKTLKNKNNQIRDYTTRNVGKLKLKKKTKIINNNNNKTTTKPPTLLFTTINNLKKQKQKRESSLLTHFELHTCFKNKKYIQKQTKQNKTHLRL